jgi:hypothetical protein
LTTSPHLTSHVSLLRIKLWDVTKGNSLATFEGTTSLSFATNPLAHCVSLKSASSFLPTAHIGAVNTVEFINAALFVSGAQVRV